jgi:hypothetical protein
MPRLANGDRRCGCRCGCQTTATPEQFGQVFGFRNMEGRVVPQSLCVPCRGRVHQMSIATPRVPNTAPQSASVAAGESAPVLTLRQFDTFQAVYMVGLELEGGWRRELPVQCAHTCGVGCYPQLRCEHANHGACCNHTHEAACTNCGHDCRRLGAHGRPNYCMGGQQTDGSVSGFSYGTRAWELTPKPFADFASMRAYLDLYHPDEVNETCGGHMHVSLKNPERDYQILTEPGFYEFFMAQVQAWCNTFRNADAKARLQRRIDGRVYYCQKLRREDIPAQRSATGKPNERYRHINYCERYSKVAFGTPTIEFRVFHAMRTPGAIMDAAKLLVNCVESYLAWRHNGGTPGPTAAETSASTLAQSMATAPRAEHAQAGNVLTEQDFYRLASEAQTGRTQGNAPAMQNIRREVSPAPAPLPGDQWAQLREIMHNSPNARPRIYIADPRNANNRIRLTYNRTHHRIDVTAGSTEDGWGYLCSLRRDGSSAGPYAYRIRETLAELAANPHEVMQRQGQATTWCCYCGEGLTDPPSVQAGYGPVCARNYGLPWGNRR